DVRLKVRQSALERTEILLRQLLAVGAAVQLQRSYGGDHDRHLRAQAGHAALDVEELLRTQVGAEAGLREDDVGERESGLGRHDAVAAVRDVPEGAGVQQRRS